MPTAVARVMTQIDGGVAGGICGAARRILILFPSRADSLQFRRELETKYQQMGRGLQSTYVDQEGAVIWIQEYLRYRVNGCDHATAGSKVFSQIDGGPVPATCFVGVRDTACRPTAATIEYTPASLVVPGAAQSRRLRVAGQQRRVVADVPRTTCATAAVSRRSRTRCAQNNAATERTGRIRFTWTGGGTDFTVTQRGIPFVASFTMFDPFKTTDPTTECWIRSSPTPCNFVVNANLPGGNYTLSVAHLVCLRDREGDLADRQHADLLVFRLMRRPPARIANGETVDLACHA